MLIKVRNADCIAHNPNQDILRLIGQSVVLVEGGPGSGMSTIKFKDKQMRIPSNYLEWPINSLNNNRNALSHWTGRRVSHKSHSF